MQIFLVSHHDDWDVRTSTEVRLVVRGLDPALVYTVSRCQVDQEMGNAYTAWLRMDKPQSPTPEQLVALHAASRLQTAMVGDISPFEAHGKCVCLCPAMLSVCFSLSRAEVCCLCPLPVVDLPGASITAYAQRTAIESR